MKKTRRTAFETVSGQVIPGLGARWWMLGNLTDMAREGALGFVFRRSLAKPAPLVMAWIGPTPLVIPRAPELIRQVLLSESGDFERDASPVVEIFGGGLLSLTGASAAGRRKIVAPPFRPQAMGRAVPAVVACANELVASWRERTGEPFKPMADTSWMMLRALGLFAFGFDFDRARHGGKPLHRALITLTTDAVTRWLSPIPYWKLYRKPAVVAARAHLLALADEVIAHGRARLRAGEALPEFLERLLVAERDGALSEDDVAGELLTFLVAGHETSATGLCWVLAVLARDPALQRRCRDEVDAVLGGGAPTLETLPKLELLGRVIRETPRLYPPVPISSHRAARDTDLGGHAIPKGTRIAVVSLITHRDPMVWIDPGVFDPDRFLPNRAAKYTRGHYFPFLAGPHTCVGIHLANIEMHVAAALTLQAFELAAAPGQVEEDVRVSLHPKGFRLALRERDVARQRGAA